MNSASSTNRAIRRIARLPFEAVARIARGTALHGRGRRLPAIAALTATATLATAPGCIAVGGARHQDTPTLGRQLIDLKAAYDGGAMSEAEYNAAKQQLLREK
ncbi:MAG: SHOCT domain-containing protein [Planctomycetota bacterium]